MRTRKQRTGGQEKSRKQQLNAASDRRVGFKPTKVRSPSGSVSMPREQPVSDVPPPTVPVPAIVPVPVSTSVVDQDALRLQAANTVVSMVENTDLPPVTIVNPESKFVIITYWWGRGNMNNNVKHPCVAYLNEEKKEAINDIKDEISNEDYIKKISDPVERQAEIDGEIDAVVKSGKLDEAIKKNKEAQIKKVAADLKISEEESRKRLLNESPALKFEAMISRFEDDCRKVNCNFLTMEYPFDRPLYQAAINGKPIFIKKAIEACKGKGPNGSDLAVVYIDGDMRANIYPKIFDMDGIDFMARGWNIDPRSSRTYLKNKVCFDPYIFETSGGIQYFANTPISLDLLETWKLSNLANPGKADDRIISLAFNVFKYQCPTAYIQLPIEYLWLTDNYLFQNPENTGVEKSIIEHPECLTAEDAAVGASTNRTPDHYTQLIESATHCERVGGKFYEYIYFPSKDLVETMGPYLEYLSKATNADEQLLFEVIPYDKKYGKHQDIADKNIKASESETEMPVSFDIPKILAQLKKGNDVTIGSDPKIDEKKKLPLEFVAYNIAGQKVELADDEHSMDTTFPDLKPEFDMTKGMFFSAKNPVLYHILAMCDTPASLSRVFNESYTFLARIRCYWLK